MKKILWIMNKYVKGEKDEAYYPHFLKHLQDELSAKDIELHFVFFSNLMKNNIQGNNNHFYSSLLFNDLSELDLQKEAFRIESEYVFTFKQAWFPDILQVSKKQNNRKITVPENELNDIEPLIKKFLFLEELISKEEIDIIFSDVSPEAEMEFGRAIGHKLGKLVLKTYEGSFLGRTVLLEHTKFGQDKLVEFVIDKNYSLDDANAFMNDYINNQGQPSYLGLKKLQYKSSVIEKVSSKILNNKLLIFTLVFKKFFNFLFGIWLWFESTILKKIIYDKFEEGRPYLFFGFHLNQESTIGLRSIPFVNQTVLIEMISRVLPYNYTLYVREHPHWPKRFPFGYLNKLKSYPNVRLLSPKISVHRILKNSKGILVYNSNTGIEALMYGKPVLSFASNIYYNHHPAVLHCLNLYEIGEKLSKLIKMRVEREDTIKYLKKMFSVSIDFLLNSYFFLSDEDAKEKAKCFSNLLTGIITNNDPKTKEVIL
ncbi:MAG: hypothetical protein HQ521_13225 [Bacteroidetes bacterium]|nr:hypothetical protein [Bacteroidota bacterium]